MAEEILIIIRMSKTNAVRTLSCMEIHSPMALALVTEEEWMRSCPCTQKKRYWKSVYAFQQEYGKSKNPESFIASYDESITMRELFAPVPRNISQDVSSVYGKSSGSMRCVKSPKINLHLDPVCTQNNFRFYQHGRNFTATQHHSPNPKQ